MSKSYSRGVQSTASTDAQQTTDQISDYIPTGATRLGIDTVGRIHYWTVAQQRITIVEPIATADGATATVATNDAISPGDAFEAYIDHVRTEAGWDSLAYDDEWLPSGLVEAV